MPLSEAVAIAKLEIREHQPHEDIDALCGLAEQAQQFSPIVGLESLDKLPWPGRTLLQPECLLLDVTGVARLFGGEEQLLAAIAQWLDDQRILGCLAIAGSIGTAWAVANYALRNPFATKQAHCHSRFQSIPPGGDRAILAQMPVAALRIESTVVDALQRLGVQRIDELWQLPRDGLASRLGQHLLTRWDQALGSIDEPIATLHESPEWQVEQSLEYATENRQTIVEVVRRLCQELALRLSRQNRGALRIVCRLDLVDTSPLVMCLGLFRPTDDAEHLQALLTGQIEHQLSARSGAALWRATVQATLVAPLIWQQTDLFDGQSTDERQQLSRLVDNLSSRLGRQQVLQANVQRQSQPELACTLSPMTGRRVDGQHQSTNRKLSSRLAKRRAEPSADDPLRRPIKLLTTPAAIDALAIADGPPAQFTFQGKTYLVHNHWGPERLESGWWRGPSHRRDYFRIATTDGSWWWIFRELNSSRWFMHGMFD